jgi:hypothetical protein
MAENPFQIQLNMGWTIALLFKVRGPCFSQMLPPLFWQIRDKNMIESY